jgi:hypothetical protein
MYKYKNNTDEEQIIPGVGVVDAHAEVVTQAPLENPNFSYVGEVETETNSIVGTEAQQPNAVVQADKVSDTPNTEVN